MEKILECVPNFSEGRNLETVAEIVETIKSVEGIEVKDFSSDADHNRSVITFIGKPEAVMEAAFLSCKKAAQLINIKTHQGVHPRIGATDVIPLVPLQNISIQETIEIAKKLGKRIGTELNIPVYLYEEAASKAENKNLANIRSNPGKPDFGPEKAGPAGATALGVRFPLIAYNVNLKSKDLKVAQQIAKKIREKDGGLPKVKALGLKLESLGITQVSMNLTDYRITPPIKAFKAIEKEATDLGVEILESELIGLIPEAALHEGDLDTLKIKNFSTEKIFKHE